MNFLLISLIFLIGLCVGSFVNVLIERSIANKNWMIGRSECDHCQKKLAWFDNIPVLSYLLLKGKSRCCHKKLSFKHPVVELMFGLLFVWWLLVGFLFFRLVSTPGLLLQPIFWLGIGILLLILAVADFRYGVIMMPIIYLASFWIYSYRGALYLTGEYQLVDLGLSVLAGLLSGLFLYILRLLTKGKGMGDGDVYLAFVTGSLLGWQSAFMGMMAAFITGAIWGIGLIMMKKKRMSQTVPFGPFLVLGAIVGLLVSRF